MDDKKKGGARKGAGRKASTVRLIPIFFKMPLNDHSRLVRLKEITGKSMVSLVCDGIKLLEQRIVKKNSK